MKERHALSERARHFLCSLPTLILFIHWMCFSLCNPPLISSHLSLCSQFCRFSKVTSENFSPSLSLTFCSSCTHGRRREVEGVPVRLSSRSKNLLWVKMWLKISSQNENENELKNETEEFLLSWKWMLRAHFPCVHSPTLPPFKSALLSCKIKAKCPKINLLKQLWIY